MSEFMRSKLSRRKFLVRASLGVAAAQSAWPLRAASGASRPQGVLTIAMAEALNATLDPQMHNNVPNYGVLTHVYDTLVERDQQTKEIRPHLAESWKTLDARTWMFTLRKGV